MKKIKVRISNYNPDDKFSYGVLLVSILSKYYEVEVVQNPSDKPEYFFFNESNYEHLDYDCVKIFYTGENVHPNFNFCDYAIGCDYMTYGDRYYRFPVYMAAQFYNDKEIALTGGRHFSEPLPFTKEDLAKKTDFCSFVYSNYLSEGSREEFFNKLSAYKKVNAGGAYLNNVGGRVPNKLEFEMKHKFSIAFENSSNIGYTTEKLPNAIVAQTIPIYWGNPEVGKEFNEARFINAMKYPSFDAVVERVKEIDQNDDLYLKIMNEPVGSTYDFKAARQGFEDFLKHIIDQPLDTARRININPGKKAQLIRNEKYTAKHIAAEVARKRFLAKLYKPFKKMGFLEKIKQRFFRNQIYKK